MTHFKKKTFFENRYSIKKLTEFRNLTEKYFSPNLGVQQEQNIRPEINKLIVLIEKIIKEADIPISITHRFTIYETIKLNLLSNFFELEDYKISSQEVIDLIDKAIGVYFYDKIPSIIRTVNPIFWFVKCLDFIFNTLFYLLQNAGFQTEEMKTGLAIKLLKFILPLSATTFIVIKIIRSYTGFI